MTEQWFYLDDNGPQGPVDLGALSDLVKTKAVQKATLVWSEATVEWRPAGEIHPGLFAVQWFYAGAQGKVGPIGTPALMGLVRSGEVKTDTLVWRRGMPQWVAASTVLTSVFRPAAPAAPALPTARQVLGNVGATLSDVADLPTIGDVPVREVFIGGLRQATAFHTLETEDEFAVGTRATTPALADTVRGWPRLAIFWRMLVGSLVTYGLLYFGLMRFHNPAFLPGLIVVGSFIVPFSVVVAFLELNVPRNVSIYAVAKMILFGGALSLVATLFILAVLPLAGTGALVPAMLTGIGEETAKGLILLLVAYSARYTYQLNGLLFGAAVGAGFAGFESAGYSFVFGLKAAYDVVPQIAGMPPQSGVPIMIGAFVEDSVAIVWLRGIFAPGGHVIWTAMVGSALWKAKGAGSFHVRLLGSPLVLRRWAIATVLHGLWDADLPGIPDLLKIGALSTIGWYLIFAMLKQALGEVDAARARVESPTRASAEPLAMATSR